MVRVTCIRCGREGSLTKKQTVSKDKTYTYFYVEHHVGDKIKWCYLGKCEKLPEEYKTLIHNQGTVIHQKRANPKNKKLTFKSENKSFFSEPPIHGPVVQWYERRPRTAEVAGSNPARSTIIVVFGFKSGDNSAELMKTDINLLPLRVNG